MSCARLTIAALPLLAIAALRGRLRVLDRPTEWRLLVAGLMLALHFATWIASLDHASVAIATLLVCTTAVWTELYAVLRRRRVDALVAASVLGALAGVAIVVGAPDRANTPLGIALALVGAVAFGAYLLAVRGSDPRYGTLAVIARTYPYAAVALGAAALLARDPLPPLHDGGAWGGIVAMALVSQLFGHTALNSAVRVLSATFVSTMTLLEPVARRAAGGLAVRRAARPGDRSRRGRDPGVDRAGAARGVSVARAVAVAERGPADHHHRDQRGGERLADDGADRVEDHGVPPSMLT